MKRKLKCLLSFLLVAAMTLMLAVPAMAVNLTINGKPNQPLTGKTFNAYQLLTATSSVDGESVVYAVNPKYSALLQLVTSKASDDEVLEHIKEVLKDAASVDAFATVVRMTIPTMDPAIEPDKVETVEAEGAAEVTLTDLAPGYYFIDEVEAETGATSRCMVKSVTADGAINIKSDYPSVEKKVKEDVSYTEDAGYGTGYNDTADYDIGDAVPFSFYSAVPDMTGYNSYQYIFHDKMSAGLTFNKDSLKVSVGDAEIPAESYSIVTEELPDESCTFEVRIADLKTVAGATTGAPIRVDFTATLNQNAEIGLPGNPNTVSLEYSSNPYDSSKTNKTPEDTVVVFTFAADINKTKSSGEQLAGAKFRLYDAATGGNEIKLSKVGTAYVVDPNGNAEIVSTTTEHIIINGLDSGTYYLEETEAPAGYNKLGSRIPIVLTATYLTDRQNWTSKNASDALTGLTATVNGAASEPTNPDNGTAYGTVVNQTGAELPETGSLGTTIFTVSGLVLMAGTSILLVTKKKMRSKK